MNFGEHIREIRNHQGISIREAAKRSGVSQPYLSQLESGKNVNPTPQIIKKISAGLGVSYTHLLEVAGLLEEGAVDRFVKSQKAANKALQEDVELQKSMQAMADKIPDLNKLLSSEDNLLLNGQMLSVDEKKKILAVIEAIMI